MSHTVFVCYFVIWGGIRWHMVIGCKLAYVVTFLTFQTQFSRPVQVKSGKSLEK